MFFCMIGTLEEREKYKKYYSLRFWDFAFEQRYIYKLERIYNDNYSIRYTKNSLESIGFKLSQPSIRN